MYDSSTGRFLQRDPIVYEGGDANLYAYVGNSPTSSMDPLGLQEATGPIPVNITNPGKSVLVLPKNIKFDNGRRTGRVDFLENVGIAPVDPKAGKFPGEHYQLKFTSDKADAKDFFWLQFVYRAIQYEGKDVLFPAEGGKQTKGFYKTPFGNAMYGQENWILDSNTPKTVFYSELPGVAVIRTPTELSVFDQVPVPFTSPPNVPQAKFDPKKYETYARFHSYLVWNNNGKLEVILELIWKVTTTVQFMEVNKQKVLLPTTGVSAGGGGRDALDPLFNVKEFPGPIQAGVQMKWPNPLYVPPKK